MIILGYPGIGKSTICRDNQKYIDLESSNFYDEYGNRPDKWWVYYCKTAIDLHRQGYTVFMSIHDEVREYFEHDIFSYNVVMVYPDRNLKDAWIKKLEERYLNSGDIGDRKAWEKTRDKFEVNLESIEKSDLSRHILTSMDYNLAMWVADANDWYNN